MNSPVQILVPGQTRCYGESRSGGTAPAQVFSGAPFFPRDFYYYQDDG